MSDHQPRGRAGAVRLALGAMAGCIASLFALPVATGAAATSITDRLSANKASIEVTSLPSGTTAIHLAVMKNMAGEGIKYLNVSTNTRVYTPPSSTPVVDAQAMGSSGPIGAWAGRLQTVPGGVEATAGTSTSTGTTGTTETTSTTTTTTTEPTSTGTTPGPFTVGLDTGGWGGGLLTELIAGGIGEFRVHKSIAPYVPAGHIASIIFGEGGTISAINPSVYALEVASLAAITHPLAVEVLNEPGGSWFWTDPTDYSAYERLARATHEAVAGLFPRPVVLCSWDGGQAGSDTFGRGIEAAGALPYCDGVTVHPYGGSSGQDGGALGNRANVERAHSESGLPVYVTEVGWPTAVGQSSTGDSQQWTEAQQATNMTDFVAWARSTGYVRMVIFFNGVDYGTNTWYGVERSNRTHKPSFQALATAAG